MPLVHFPRTRTQQMDTRLCELLRRGRIKKLTGIGEAISYAMGLVRQAVPLVAGRVPW